MVFLRGFFIISQANMRGFFTVMPWLYLFFVPAVTMKLWAEERKLGTVEILMTLPIKDYEVILGKYLASFALLGVTILLSLSLPIAVASLGDPDGGPIVGGYIGLLLMGAAYLSIGLFASTLTENQIVSFIVGIGLCFVLLIIGEDIVLFNIHSPWLASFLSYLGLGTHFGSLLRGVIDSRDLIYYFSLIGFFLYLSALRVQMQKVG
jgi:ABC-2 type transport system permease protein